MQPGMRRTLSCTFTLAAALAPATASAGSAAEQVAADLETTLAYLPALRESPAERLYGGEGSAAECKKAVAKGQKAGLKDTDRIYAWRFRELEDDVHFDDDREPYLELGEIATLCDEYDLLRKMVPAAGMQAELLEQVTIYAQQDPKDLAADLGQQFVAKGQKCVEVTDQAIRDGAPGDRRTRIGTLELTLAEGRAQICEAAIAFGGKFAGDIKAAKQAEFDRVAAKYKKVGIKGDKLKVFVENDNIDWMTKGCQTLTDLKKLAKAKKLFQWWDAPDGTITIRTYTFKGNKVKSIKNKQYAFPEHAYKGCK